MLFPSANATHTSSLAVLRSMPETPELLADRLLYETPSKWQPWPEVSPR